MENQHVLIIPSHSKSIISFIQSKEDPCAIPTDAHLVTQTPHASIYTVNTSNDDTAQAIAKTTEKDYDSLVTIFGQESTPSSFTIFVEDNVGGAYHCDCDGTIFFVDNSVNLGASFNAAELVEVFEASIHNGWDCGQTNGEALSRALAAELHPELGHDMLQTEIGWWNNGANDYISANIADDRNEDSNGCGLLFLYFLHNKLKNSWSAIAQAGGSSLAQTYAALTKESQVKAFSVFIQELRVFVGSDNTLTLPANGNPWA